MELTQADILQFFQPIGSIRPVSPSVDNSDQFLLISVSNGTVRATKISAELVRTYLNVNFEISVSDDGFLVIGGTKTQHQVAGVTPMLRRGTNGVQCSTDNGQTWSYIAYFSDFGTDNVVMQTADTVNIRPNVLNVWNTDKTQLNISFTSGSYGVVNEYMIQFQCGSTPTTLNLPEEVRWVDDEPLICEENHVYQVSIVNGMAVGAGWPKGT